MEIRGANGANEDSRLPQNSHPETGLQGDELIVRQVFEFESDLQRMSCVVEVPSARNEYQVFVKGSPEMMSTLFLRDSVPKDYQRQLHKLSIQGLRILALGHRRISRRSLGAIRRSEIECELDFLGFIAFENELKPDTRECMKRLLDAHLNCKVISGDNPITSIQCARECSLLDATQNTFVVDVEENLVQNWDQENAQFLLQRVPGIQELDISVQSQNAVDGAQPLEEVLSLRLEGFL